MAKETKGVGLMKEGLTEFLVDKMHKTESFFMTVSEKQPKMKHSRLTREVFITSLLHGGDIAEVTFKVKLGVPRGVELNAKFGRYQRD